jgi:NitT/TauT family transport system permease protein
MNEFKGIISFIVIMLGWEICVRSLDVPATKFPSPWGVAKGLFELASSGVLFHHIIASLYRVSWGYFLAVGSAIPLGLILGIWSTARAYLNPVIQFLRPISPLAWIPIALLWFGIGDMPAIFLIFLATFLPMVVFSMSGVSGVKTTYLRVARNFGLKGYELYLKVILPASLPDIVVGLRITLGTAWLVIVAAEMIAVKSGLGYLIIDSRNSLRMDYVIGAMFIIGIIGFILDHLIRQFEVLPSIKWIRTYK